MQVIIKGTPLETTNIFGTKTFYRRGAGRMQWGEEIGTTIKSNKRKYKAFRINNDVVA